MSQHTSEHSDAKTRVKSAARDVENPVIRSKYDAELSSLSVLCDDLERVAKKLRGRDAKIIRSALQALGEHGGFKEDLRSLGRELLELETEHEFETNKFPEQMGKVDLGACICALEAVIEFLADRVVSRNLVHLRSALLEIAAGASPAAMFQPEEHGRGRRVDAPLVVKAKGMLAGMMQVQQSVGMSRQEAAEWIVRNVSPKLATRISSKPLTARMVEEWLDRFGGTFGEEGIGRESYLLWSAHDPVSPQRFGEITEHFSKQLLARKPK